MVHKGRTHITNAIRLLQLSPKTQKALNEKKITSGHAKILVGLDEKQQLLIVNSVIGQKLSVREVEAMVKKIKEEKIPLVDKIIVKEQDFLNIKDIQDRFNFLGFKSKTSKNKITIEFKHEEQVEEFLEQISK